MSFDLAFVDSIAASPVTRLNLNDDISIRTLADDTDFGVPELDRAFADTLLADGAIVPAAAYGNRVLKLGLRFLSGFDANAALLQSVIRELDRPNNFLRYRAGTTNPVFFRTLRSSASGITWDPFSQEAVIPILAEPFGYGQRVDLPAVTVYNDPAEGTTLNGNPFFETDASNWTVLGGTFVRSTAQFHEGVASGLLTPSGVASVAEVDSDHEAVTVGQSYRVSAWLRCAVSRNIVFGINWYNGANAFLSDSLTTVAVTAATWGFADFTATAPAGAAFAALVVSETGTPPASNTLHVDEARLRMSDAGGAGGMCFDITGVQGDVETPPLIRITNATPFGAGALSSVIAVRRRGTPSAMPLSLQCESMTLGTDTTLPGNDATMSGAGSNYARCSFATVTGMSNRLTINNFPTSALNDARGRYRVWLRNRQNTGADVFAVRLGYGAPGVTAGNVVNDAVTLTGTGLRWVDLGDFSIPIFGDLVEDGPSGVQMPPVGLGIGIGVQRVSGVGTFDMDALLFVPADDDYAAIGWSVVAAQQPAFLVLDSFHDTIYPMDNGPLMHSNNQGIPRSGSLPMLSPNQTNRLVMVVNATPQGSFNQPDSITHTATVVVSYWPRYVSVARPVSS